MIRKWVGHRTRFCLHLFDVGQTRTSGGFIVIVRLTVITRQLGNRHV